MELIESVNPERIAWCCEDQNITPKILASELNIAPATIERAMDGKDALTFNQLRKMADHFGRGVLFFLDTEPVNEMRVHTTQFRTLANQKPELSVSLKLLIERVEKQRDVYLSLREDLDSVDYPSFAPPDLPPENPRKAATIVREWLGLGDYNSFESYRTAVEAQGLLVFRSNGYNGKWQIAKENPILGFALYDQTCPVIVVKKQTYETRQTFTLMHELGHLLLHKTSSIDDDRDFQSHKQNEREANTFAGHLLVPNTFLNIIQDDRRPSEISQCDEWLEPQRKAWGVSGEVILRRLLDSGRLPEGYYDAYRDWREQLRFPEKKGGNRKGRFNEPKYIFGDTFVKIVFDALYAHHVTLNKASGYLDNLKIEHLHQLERQYAGL